MHPWHRGYDVCFLCFGYRESCCEVERYVNNPVILTQFQIRLFLGVSKISVALLAGRAEVLFDRKLISPVEIAQAITNIGYTATVAERHRGEKIGSLELKVSTL